jgi:hypothetical protein
VPGQEDIDFKVIVMNGGDSPDGPYLLFLREMNPRDRPQHNIPSASEQQPIPKKGFWVFGSELWC